MRFNIVILAAVEWRHIVQAQHFFARFFSEEGHNVIFFEPLPHRYPNFRDWKKVINRLFNFFKHSKKTEVEDKIKVVSPITFPETNIFFRKLNKLLLKFYAKRIKSMCFNSITIVEIWKPLEGFYYITKMLNPNLMLYSCVDNYIFENKAPKHYIEVEKKIIKESDAVIVKSDYIARRIMKIRPDIYRRDSAVDYNLFKQAQTGVVKSAHKLCYFGVISDRLDLNLILDLANKGYKVLMLGPVKRLKVDISKLHKNIYNHPPVPYENVPEYIKNCDCIILPYAINEYNKGVHLAKLYECFATGKPILSTPLPCLEKFKEIVYIGKNSEDFIFYLENLKDLENEDKYSKRIKLAKENSWENRFKQELAIILQILEAKSHIK